MLDFAPLPRPQFRPRWVVIILIGLGHLAMGEAFARAVEAIVGMVQ